MPIRITGMNSGLDTESIIAEMVKVEKKKVETTKKEKTAFEWKQEAWKDLNAKIYKLFRTTLDNMRFAGDWSKKTTELSNSSIASIVTADDAMNTTQKLEVKNLASAGYMTGGKVTAADGSVANGGTKLSDLGLSGGTTVELNVRGKTTTIQVDDGMTINDFTYKLQDAGVEARFDQANGRFHIAAKNNGEKISFSSSNPQGEGLLENMGLLEGAQYGDKAAHVTGGDKAKIILNGVEYESTNNTFNINGLTITAKEVGESTLNTKRDTQNVYDTVKNFIKEYNSLINEMDKLYNAESSKGYDPLTDEEKEAMSEKEIEKWEGKIKDSVLRRDSTLGSISTTLKEIMLKGATVNGKQMVLSNFGIETLGYYEAEDNERNAYHISGDEDFPSKMTETNQLKAMVEQDPDTVIEFFSQLTMNMYKKMDEMSSSIDKIRSYGKFYDDKVMEDEYKSYESKIAKQEKALLEKEDKWYKKFSAMETALAKLQSNQNALSSLLGG